jgi:ABC-2 type transport system ATP-binding protein
LNKICVRDLNLIIKKAQILININVEFEQGRIHGLVGRNGTVKTDCSSKRILICFYINFPDIPIQRK